MKKFVICYENNAETRLFAENLDEATKLGEKTAKTLQTKISEIIEKSSSEDADAEAEEVESVPVIQDEQLKTKLCATESGIELTALYAFGEGIKDRASRFVGALKDTTKVNMTSFEAVDEEGDKMVVVSLRMLFNDTTPTNVFNVSKAINNLAHVLTTEGVPVFIQKMRLLQAIEVIKNEGNVD